MGQATRIRSAKEFLAPTRCCFPDHCAVSVFRKFRGHDTHLYRFSLRPEVPDSHGSGEQCTQHHAVGASVTRSPLVARSITLAD